MMAAGAWRAKLNIFVLLIVPLYVLPCLLRTVLLPYTGWVAGLLLADAFGCAVVAFLTNNVRGALLLYLAATAFEFTLATAGNNVRTALWIGDALPALVGIYFAERLFVNMGD
jgi:hypothetical protein